MAMKAFTLVTFAVLISGECVLTQECHDGWTQFHNSCYLYVDHTADDWGGSEFYCKTFGGYLVEINSAEENTLLINWLRGKHVTAPMWIGGNDIEAEAKYVWAKSQTRFDFTYWYNGEPNDLNHSEDCVAMYQEMYNFRWNDYPCERKLNFMCEHKQYTQTWADIKPYVMNLDFGISENVQDYYIRLKSYNYPPADVDDEN